MAGRGVTSSPLRRLLRLGGLAGRVGVSVAGHQLAALTRSPDSRSERRTANLVRNAERLVATLGELKGAAMKVGQMLSLQDAALPPEVAAVLRSLQKQAPPIPFEVVEEELATQVPRYRELFARLEETAFAAASIGQVHRGVLRDGRRVAVKIQYPLIDRIIAADLGNLRRVLGALVGLVTDIDFDPIWRELSARLTEELDYLHEADNMRRMAALHAGVPEIVIPRVVDEATTRSVLTMEYLEGMPPDEACSPRTEQALKDRWGLVLFDFLLRGLFEHRLLHADPNIANFAFLPDGRVIVYDFGCLKEVSAKLSRGYRDLSRAALAGRADELPRLLTGIGISRSDGEPLPADLAAPYVELVLDLLRERPAYRFGEDSRVYGQILSTAWDNLGEAASLRFPHDIVFIHRTVAGHFGNLTRLKAAGPWREHLERSVSGARRAGASAARRRSG